MTKNSLVCICEAETSIHRFKSCDKCGATWQKHCKLVPKIKNNNYPNKEFPK